MRGLLVLLVALAFATPASGAAVHLVADDDAPPAGSTLTLSVEIDAVSIGCFTFSVEYDPAVLGYLGAAEGTLFSSAPQLTYFSDDVDALGRPQPNDCLLGFGTFVTGPGSVATLSFEVLTADPTAVTLRDVILRDVDRLEIGGVGEATAWIHATGTATPQALAGGGLSARPNPSSQRLSLVLSGPPAAAAGRVSIFDLAGRLVRDLAWPARASSLQWDGRDLDGRPVANGIYLARFESGSRRATTRIVRVR